MAFVQKGWECIELRDRIEDYPIEAKLHPLDDSPSNLDQGTIDLIEKIGKRFRRKDREAWQTYIYAQFLLPVSVRRKIGLNPTEYRRLYREGRDIARMTVRHPWGIH
jgi:hypothetical protein